MLNEINQYSQNEVVDIFKAISSNDFAQLKGPAAQTGGAALIPESLENTLRTLTFTEKNLKLWKEIPKVKAFSNVEEYNVVDSYGEDISSFQAEGYAGSDTTSNYERKYALIKCMNTTRSVTQLMELVKTTSNVEAMETQNGMRYLLGQTEQALFYGDSTLAANKKEGLEWNGLFKQVEQANTINLNGEYLTDKHLNSASETILNNYGIPNKVYMPIHVAGKFSEQYYPNQRALMNVQPGTVTAGTTVTQFNSIGGTIDVTPDVFMRRGLEVLDPKKPAAGENPPTAPTATAAQTEEEGANFKEGTYKYAVVAMNSKGRSVPVEVSQAIAVNSDGVKKPVTITITNSKSQLSAPDYFIIYRTEENGDKYYEIARIGAATSNPSGETKFVDKNETLPNTAQAIVGDFTAETLAFKQLAPMFKLPYAIVAPVKRFGIFLYGSPVVYAPKKFVLIKNIKVK